MQFYQLLTFILLLVIPFFPKQIDERITYLIITYAVFLLPVFVKTILSIFHLPGVLRPPGRWTQGTVLFFILFLIVSTVSTIFSIDKNLSIPQLILYFSYLVIFVSSKEIFNSLKSKQRLAVLLITIVAILSAISIYNTLMLQYINKEGIGVSFMWVYFDHNHLSALLIFAIPFCFFVLKTNWDKLIYKIIFSLIFIFLLFSLILTSAQASLISLSMVSYLFFLGYVYRSKQKLNFILAFWILVIVIIILSVLSRQGIVQWDSVIYNLNIPARLIYVRSAVENVRLVPFIGTGLDTYKLINLNIGWGLTKTDYVHNFFFQMLTDTGIFGFVISIMLVVSVLWESGKRVFEKLEVNERFFFLMLWLSLIASTINTLVDFDWQLPTVFFIFWLVAGLI